MNEFQVRDRRVRGRGAVLVQETFKALAPGSEPALANLVVGEREEGSYREDLARWPLRWRERWGRRANALEDLGLGWRRAELRAFAEVRDERQAKVRATGCRSLAAAAPA